MKKSTFLIVGFLLCAFSLKAQTVDTAKMHRFQDSVKKYRNIFTYYQEYAPQKDSVMNTLLDLELNYRGKLDSMAKVAKHYRDSIGRISRRQFLQNKYHIKLN